MMNRLLWRLLAAVLMLPLLASLSSTAAEQGQRRVVKGIVVYLGIMPGEILQGEMRGHTDPKMHEGIPPGQHVYHVMVALFDQATGRRLSDAEVALDAADMVEPAKHVKLEPMAIGGTLVYGNYVDLPGNGPYRLTVIARLQGMPDTIQAEFNYQHARI